LAIFAAIRRAADLCARLSLNDSPFESQVILLGPTLGRPNWGAIVNIYTPPGADESKESSEVEIRRDTREARDQIDRGDLKVSAAELAAVLRRMSDASISEVEQLISQLQKLRTRLQNASYRIQADIAEYSELSQQTMQLTSIIVDSVRKLPPPR
jgi:hypothetical protein